VSLFMNIKMMEKTIVKERGINNLDYTVYKKDKYTTKYYAVKTTEKEQSLNNKYLDTLMIYNIEYNENGIIKLIRKQNYNPTTHEWEKSIINYNSVISKDGNLLKVHFSNNSGLNIEIKIDNMGNWVYKS